MCPGRLALPKTTPHQPYRRCLSTGATKRQDLASQPPNTEHLAIDPASLPPGVRTDIRDPSHPVAQDYILKHHSKAVTSHLGATPEPHYRPRDLLANPPRPDDITLELLLASQSHIGHATSLWHPANAKYIFGVRGDQDPIHIISLDTTAAYLRRACKVVKGVTERGGLVLFVGTRAGQARTVVKAAQMAKGCHLFSRWTPGSITNGQQILGACRKKVVNEKDEEIVGFQDQLEYKAAIKPDLVVCLNPLENYILLHECGLHNVPTIGIIDTDANPTWVTYPIPANDDSHRCVNVIAGVLGRAGEAGQEARLRAARRGEINYAPTHGLKAPTPGQAQKEREAMEREAQEERAYIDEGEVVEDSIREQEELGAASKQMEQGMLGGMLDAGIEGAGESATYGSLMEEGADVEAAFHEDLPEVLVDSSLSGEQSGEQSETAGVGVEEQGLGEDYAVDRELSGEEMKEGEENSGAAARDELFEEEDAAQFGIPPADGKGGRRDR